MGSRILMVLGGTWHDFDGFAAAMKPSIKKAKHKVKTSYEFDDLTQLDRGRYDLVIGDEAWEIDHYLHENPERKSSAFVWLTDFVGWLPMPSGGEHEAYTPPTTTPR